jgi:iron complex outermembrane receptor protein
VLTDQFSRWSPAAQLNALFDSANATAATFFANAIDTQSKGIDVVVSHKGNIGNGLTLKTDLSELSQILEE